MSSLPPEKMAGLDKDVVTEIFSYLPLKSLFRCRAVCKLWRDVIDSPFLRKLHIHTHTHTRSSYSSKEEDEKVYLQLDYDGFDDDSDVKVSIKVVEKGNSVDLNTEGFSLPMLMARWDVSSFIRPVKGLICFNLWVEDFVRPILICNPFLVQFKILPFSPIRASPDPCEPRFRHVGIGCDGEFYKVVELVDCEKHRRLHAHLYSRRTDSWRKLGDFSRYLSIFGPIMLSCSDGHFVHWYGRYIWQATVLTFDMKNEVFSSINMCTANIVCGNLRSCIVAKDEDSFIVIIPPRGGSKLMSIYESSIHEENGIRMLSLNHVVDLEEPVVQTVSTPLPLWRRDCVMLRFFDDDQETKVLFYDYVARRFVGCFKLPINSDLFCYKGTFISP